MNFALAPIKKKHRFQRPPKPKAVNWDATKAAVPKKPQPAIRWPEPPDYAVSLEDRTGCAFPYGDREIRFCNREREVLGEDVLPYCGKHCRTMYPSWRSK